VVLPLRAFLGGTFLFAGLQKLADKHFFDATSPSSIQAQLHASARNSPIGGALALFGHVAVLVGLAIAVGEVAVGLAAVVGLWTRAAAVGGALLSLSFLLSVSWHVRPYYYGSDIVFLVAWMPLILVGSGGVLSLDSLLRQRARNDLRLPPSGPVSIEFAAVRRLCGAYDNGSCALRQHRACEPGPCPVLLAGPSLRPDLAANLDRRVFLQRARAAVGLAAGAAGLGVGAAIIGRLVPSDAGQPVALSPRLPGPAVGSATSTTGSADTTTVAPGTTVASSSSHGATATAPRATTPTTASSTRGTAPVATHPPGAAIGAASAVPAGGAAQFTDPATGNPAYVLRSANGQFRAFSAVCTHAGCTVNYSASSQEFVCPCHGAQFDGTNGAVVRGPARSPLPPIAVAEGSDGQLYAR
jgi:thiosulfate dehydrogenase [quinone] large subunit